MKIISGRKRIPTSQGFASLPICVKIFHSQLYLVATVFHIQSLCSPEYAIRTYSSHYSEAGRAKNKNKKKSDSKNCPRAKEIFLRAKGSPALF